ncbi:hypothetical protein ACS3SW_18830 [Roseobacteraceae bacterium S113]
MHRNVPMGQPLDIPALVTQLSALVEEKIGPRGPDLKRQVARVGRRLPRAVRNDILVVAHAADLAGHPSLSRQINAASVTLAYDRAVEALKPIDPVDRRRGALLSWLGDNAFNLLALLGLTLVVLRLRGFI